MIDIKIIEEKIGYNFNNKNYLISALTHKSYAHDKKMKDLDSYNERLEFLGDAVLEHAISIYLFNLTPKLTEGEMSRKRSEIVCEDSLCRAVKKVGLDKYICLGNCELAIGGKKNAAILADMTEAIFAAVYLDSNFEHANSVIMKVLKENICEVMASNSLAHDYKTRLQEILQKNGTVKIEYIIDKEEGDPRNKIFYSSVYLDGKKLGEGNGRTKKAAEQEAAKQAIERM